MSRSFPDQTFQTESCGLENEIKNWKAIQECANSTDGSTLLKENGMKTEQLNPSLTSVPTILFREHYDDDAQKLALVSFPRALCREIQPTPHECTNQPGAASQNVLATMALIGAFIATTFF